MKNKGYFMRLVSWNVNGIRAVMKKDFISSLNSMETDVLCLQETKAQDEQVSEALKEIEAAVEIFCSGFEVPGL